MFTFGVLLKDTQISQINYEVIRELNVLNQEHNKISFSIFYLNSTPICVNNFCSLQTIHDIHKIKNGILVATDLDTALILSKSQTLARKIYYIHNLEFIYYNRDYLNNYKLMHSMDLWTRSESYQDIINNYCNIRPKILNDMRSVINAY